MVGHAFRVDECSNNLHAVDGRHLVAIQQLILVVYLDDILIFSQTLEEHLHHI